MYWLYLLLRSPPLASPPTKKNKERTEAGSVLFQHLKAFEGVSICEQ